MLQSSSDTLIKAEWKYWEYCMEDFSVLKDGADDERKRRKGDNIFFFVNNK